MDGYCTKSSGRDHSSRCNTLCLLNILLFFLCVLMYIVNEIFLIHKGGFFKNHFNDLLAIPLLLSFSSVWAYINKKTLGVWWLSAITLLAMVSWEIITPFIFHHGTSDIKDIYCYTIGYILYLYSRFACATGI
jgi:hypothetical protein